MSRAKRRARSSSRSGQGMVEFALIAPLAFLTIFLVIDFGRLMFVYVSLASQAQDAKRLVTLRQNQSSDCYTLQHLESTTQAYHLTADPNSYIGDTDPSNPSGTQRPSTPPAGEGYVYIWPAVATAAPADSNCTGTNPRRTAGSSNNQVSVEVSYHFIPWTPLVSHLVPSIMLTSVSDGQVEY